MKAILIHQYGDSSEFKKEEISRPKSHGNQVLVKVSATSVNPIDIKIRKGVVQNAFQPNFPMILHSDFSGQVIEVGESVTKFSVGDFVFGFNASGGALSDFIVVEESVLAKASSQLPIDEAASLPLTSITAWEALVDRGKVKQGDHVLVHGGTGGVGHIAIQLAKAFGAIVSTTVSSNEKAELVKSLGADHVINYKEESVDHYVNRLTGGKGFDIVFDTVGNENLDKSFVAVKPKGTVLAIAARSTHDLTLLHNKSLTLHVVFIMLTQKTEEGRKEHGVILNKITNLIEENKLKPLINPKTFTYDQVQEAHDYFENNKVEYGKVIITNS
ncbi:zinc-binding dehydrogenase [Bacillus sp. AFS041924]|uniref:zinc-binding dehydrogenase n=1 Tax=Bacillus sp. AFS041924 TaxID=2033503 RepID=UPI000BFE8FD9|nr:zinc-binding dehydrogenase [Bacillus sp. AFS041924]PGS50456.1 quinone oxidoreductase [Bacillus sp. AFS041924]